MKLITPIILVGVSIAIFFTFSKSFYDELRNLRTQAVFYNKALDNAQALESERDKLTAKFNSINPENLVKLSKLLPSSIDNIRLILEIEQIALPYGMALKDVKYSPATDNVPSSEGEVFSDPMTATSAQQFDTGGDSGTNYGVWDLEFTTAGTYDNFLNFLADLERNLRIVDMSSIQFSSGETGSDTASVDYYTYNFKIKTYWLKN